MDGNTEPTACKPANERLNIGGESARRTLNKEYPLLMYVVQETRLAMTRQEQDRLMKCVDEMTLIADTMFPHSDEHQAILLSAVADFMKDSLAGNLHY